MDQCRGDSPEKTSNIRYCIPILVMLCSFVDGRTKGQHMRYLRLGEYDLMIPPSYAGSDKIAYLVETSVDIADEEGFNFVGFFIKKKLGKSGIRVVIYVQEE